MLIEERARDLDGARDDIGNLHGCDAQVDLAARDSRDIEQIIDE